jgi:uncharacterized membrane protein
MTNTMQQGGGGRPSPWRLAMWGAIAALLIAPAVAMQVTDEVAWTASDFVFAGVLLVGAGAIYEVAARTLRKPWQRMTAAAVLVLAVLVIWAQGAVGIF